MKKILLLIALVFVVASSLPVEAQTVCETNCVVRVGQPVIVFTEAMPSVSVYKLFVNGTQMFAQSAIVNGFIEFYLKTGLSKPGDYTFQMRCVYVDGTEDVCTDPNTLRATRGKIKFR